MQTKLQYLGWDAFILTSPKGVRLMLDPFLAGVDWLGVPPSTFKPEDIDVDLICASHASLDHFGDGFNVMRACPKSKLIGGVDVVFHAEKAGFGTTREGRTELIVSGAQYTEKDMHIRCVDARHISWTQYDGHPVTGTAHCYVVKIDGGPTFFFSGDTSITMDMELWCKLYRPDVAMLGIGGALCASGRSLDELDPVEAAIAAEMLGVKRVIPMHYITQDYLDWFHKECYRLKNCKCLDMKCGDTVAFDEPLPYQML